MVDLHHLLHDGLRRHGVAQPPTGHGKGLGKAIDINAALLHAGHGNDGNMVFPAVGQLGINLVGDDEQVVLQDDRHQLFQVFLFHDGAGRIVGVGDEQGLGFRRDGRFQFLRLQAEIVFLLQVDGHRNAAGHAHAGLVGNEAGLGQDHLVAGLHRGTEGQVDRLAAADGNEALLSRIVGDTDLARGIIADGPAQLRQASVGCVKCFAGFDSFDGFLADGPGRVEIRLTHAQGDRVGHFCDHVKKLPDAGRRHVHDFFCKKIPHGVTTILLSFFGIT